MNLDFINCHRCHSPDIVQNGKTRHGKQRYKCKMCQYQFSEHSTAKIICPKDIEKINALLLERLSLRGICRVMKVSLPWLLKHISTLYDNLPDDLNVLSDDLDITSYADDQLSKLIYSFLEKKRTN